MSLSFVRVRSCRLLVWLLTRCSCLLQDGPGVPEGSPSEEERQQAVAALQSSACSLAQLYNDFASRFRLWALALRAVDLAKHDDAKFISQLWDVALRQACLPDNAPLQACSRACVWQRSCTAAATIERQDPERVRDASQPPWLTRCTAGL